MTPTMYDDRTHMMTAASARADEGPSPYWTMHREGTEQSPPKLRPGAAIIFAIAAVVAVLSFIEVLVS